MPDDDIIEVTAAVSVNTLREARDALIVCAEDLKFYLDSEYPLGVQAHQPTMEREYKHKIKASHDAYRLAHLIGKHV